MPESGNIHPAFLMIDAIDDPVGPHNNLANERIVKLGHDSPISGKSASRFVLLTRNWPKVSARSGESSEM